MQTEPIWSLYKINSYNPQTLSFVCVQPTICWLLPVVCVITQHKNNSLQQKTFLEWNLRKLSLETGNQGKKPIMMLNQDNQSKA